MSDLKLIDFVITGRILTCDSTALDDAVQAFSESLEESESQVTVLDVEQNSMDLAKDLLSKLSQNEQS